eukprot:scaffold203250_cov21-Tisochrysis_lutea.AAC.2
MHVCARPRSAASLHRTWMLHTTRLHSRPSFHPTTPAAHCVPSGNAVSWVSVSWASCCASCILGKCCILGECILGELLRIVYPQEVLYLERSLRKLHARGVIGHAREASCSQVYLTIFGCTFPVTCDAVLFYAFIAKICIMTFGGSTWCECYGA